MKKAEVVCALAVLTWAALMLRESTELNIWWGPSGPGAGFFPFWLSVGLAVSAIIILIRAVRMGPDSNPKKTRFIPEGALLSLFKVILPIAGVILAMEFIGFYLAAAFYLIVSMRWIGRHSWSLSGAISLLFPVATYFVFERWFLILLPKGYLGPYLPF